MIFTCEKDIFITWLETWDISPPQKLFHSARHMKKMFHLWKKCYSLGSKIIFFSLNKKMFDLPCPSAFLYTLYNMITLVLGSSPILKEQWSAFSVWETKSRLYPGPWSRARTGESTQRGIKWKTHSKKIHWLQDEGKGTAKMLPYRTHSCRTLSCCVGTLLLKSSSTNKVPAAPWKTHRISWFCFLIKSGNFFYLEAAAAAAAEKGQFALAGTQHSSNSALKRGWYLKNEREWSSKLKAAGIRSQVRKSTGSWTFSVIS